MGAQCVLLWGTASDTQIHPDLLALHSRTGLSVPLALLRLMDPPLQICCGLQDRLNYNVTQELVGAISQGTPVRHVMQVSVLLQHIVHIILVWLDD